MGSKIYTRVKHSRSTQGCERSPGRKGCCHVYLKIPTNDQEARTDNRRMSFPFTSIGQIAPSPITYSLTESCRVSSEFDASGRFRTRHRIPSPNYSLRRFPMTATRQLAYLC